MSVAITTLDRLKPGHEYPGANLNARLLGREKGIEELAASIAAEGILQSLNVLEHPKNDKVHFVIDGNRRLRALHLLVKQGKWDAKKDPVPVIYDKATVNPIGALRRSLAANETQLPMHPVDRYRAFAAVFEKEKDTKAVAAHYGIKEKEVLQTMALGKLADCVLDAWAAEKIDREEAEAFTLTSDKKLQEEVFNRLKKRGSLYEMSIRKEIVGEQRNAAGHLKFVGEKLYQDSGGKISTDLFTEDSRFASDPALLQKLVQEKLKVKQQELVKQGWAWATLKADLPSTCWSWEKLKGKAKTASAAQKAKAGCIIELQSNGQLEITYGVIAPGAKAAKKAKEKRQEEKGLSAKLHESLCHTLTAAAADALKDEAELGLAVFLASALSMDNVLHISVGGDPEQIGEDSDEADSSMDFEDALKRTLKMSHKEKVAGFAKLAARALDFYDRYGPKEGPLENSSVVDICKVLPAKKFSAALADRFDAAGYFASIPGIAILNAVEEALGKEQRKALEGKKKSEMAEFAAKELPKKGWLPEELRTVHYTGPKAKKGRKQ